MFPVLTNASIFAPDGGQLRRCFAPVVDGQTYTALASSISRNYAVLRTLAKNRSLLIQPDGTGELLIQAPMRIKSGGSAATPDLQFGLPSNSQWGFYHPSNFTLYMSNAGSAQVLLNSNTAVFGLNSGYKFAWAAGNVTSTFDLWLRRGAAATLVQGDTDAAVPVSQTLAVQNVATGTTDTAGAVRYIDGSRGSGAALGGDIVLRAAPPTTTGNTQNPLTAVFTIKGDAHKCTVNAGPAIQAAYTVAQLPAASAVQYARCFVSDASATLAAGIGTTVAGGGSNKVPVHSDGANWIIG